MNVFGSYGKEPNYEPTAYGGPKEDKSFAIHKQEIEGPVGRYTYNHPNTNFEQPRTLFNKVFDDSMRKKVIQNISGHLG